MDECQPLVSGHYNNFGTKYPLPKKRQGKAVQVDPMKSTLKAPGTEGLKLQYDDLLSSFAFKFCFQIQLALLHQDRVLAEFNTAEIALSRGQGPVTVCSYCTAVPGQGPHCLLLLYRCIRTHSPGPSLFAPTVPLYSDTLAASSSGPGRSFPDHPDFSRFVPGTTAPWAQRSRRM